LVLDIPAEFHDDEDDAEGVAEVGRWEAIGDKVWIVYQSIRRWTVDLLGETLINNILPGHLSLDARVA
jgi:hypothetical protein